MGVYLRDMEEPKRCGECDLWSNCFYPKNPYTEQDEYILDDCPLIEIDLVRCGECKHFAGEGMYCANNIVVHFDHFFCYYGERRANDSNT